MSKFPHFACVIMLLGVVCVFQRDEFAQTASAATQALKQPGFDVASIRPMLQDDNTPTHITNSPRNGYIKAVNVNLKALLEVAYNLPDLRMYGGPDWVSKEKFSLEAKADPKLDEQIASLSPEEGKQIKRNMLVALLADRFKLKVHTESREMAVYAMVVAKGGAKLAQTSSQVSASLAGTDRITVTPGSDSLAVLAYELSWRLDRPVVDRTGLQYRQELNLSWRDDAESLVDASGASLFTAIQEQLGLRLEATRGAVPVLLIDHAEKPSEN